MQASKWGTFLALLLFSQAYAQSSGIPLIRQENCGAIISSVIAVCSQPELGRPEWCCNELKRWNDAHCWCESNAFDALDSVASNGYAYAFRDGYCGEAFHRPERGAIAADYATCPPFGSIPDWDTSENCDGITPTDLRAAREASLESLRTDAAADAADLNGWFSRMDALFTEDAEVDIVGIFLGHGRFEVKQYLMTRQSSYGYLPITLDFTGEHFWRSPNMVSYIGGSTEGGVYYVTRDFVTFESCSARIDKWYVVDENYMQRYHQTWDAGESRLMRRYMHTAASWCAQVETRCTGDTYPFASSMDCQEYFESLQSVGRVTCNRFEQDYVPQYAIHGDTIACRSFYADLAIVDPKGACPAVGRNPNQARCGAEECPGNSWIDPFARDAALLQFSQAPSVECAGTTCVENWPMDVSEGQRSSVAEGARTMNGPPRETPIPEEVLQTDDDSLMNVAEQDANAPGDRLATANMPFGAENIDG